ncbi:MAG TPA: hypothetical protein ACFYD7_08635 [Candidatus Wujingus californicus]|uniref:hypothetical protein n=1 Tax=Candidatus Wujingus californicus TaxID=3367618 RepID=UPI001DD7D71F|nr:hypothetical protein [Planctomycetota bacterium]
MKLGIPIDLKFTARYYRFNRQFAIRDVFDALVELITNSDDSYHNLYEHKRRSEDGGPVLVEICEQRKGEPSLVVVRDKAEGMTLQEMVENFGDVGTRRSRSGARGFMGRGAKDCTALGSMAIESIKDDKYYKCELTDKPQLIPQIDKKSVTEEIRKTLGIENGNGTVITLKIEAQHKIPRIDTIVRDLPWHFALRDILSEHSPTKVLIKNLNNPKIKLQKAVYRQPEGELVCDEKFAIPGYQDAIAKLKIWKVPEPFDDLADKSFRRSGIIIKGKRAIHECSLLYPGFEKDQYALKYFGRLECDYIDKLMDEYDGRQKNDEPHPVENPILLIDPNRREGLIKEHPFTQSLFQIPKERLKSLIDKEKEQAQTSKAEVVSKETRDMLNDLAKAASKFLMQQIEDLEVLTPGEEVDENFFRKQGVLIYPTYPKIAISEIRPLTFYVNRHLFNKEGQEVEVKSDNTALSVLDSPFKLRAHPKKSDRLIGTFRIKGEKINEGVLIETICDGLPSAQAIVQVVENRLEDHIFTSSLEFEHKLYQIKEGSSRNLKLFAKCPELVNQETTINIVSSDSVSVPVIGRCHVLPIVGTNYALGEVAIKGRRLIKDAVTITASINGDKAITKVKVIQREEKGVKIEIDLRDEDFGNFRALWAEHEGKPNLLLISARHDSIRRYLKYNPETKEWEGDKKPHFRVLLAEIVAESVCRKALTLEAKARAWEFKFADLKDDHVIADAVLAQLQKRIRNFAAIAHSIMFEV